MATDTQTSSTKTTTTSRRSVKSEVVESVPYVYDRSSMPAEFMVTIPDQTEDDFFQFAPSSRFCELIDGVVYMPSPVSSRHQLITMFLSSLLQLHCGSHKLGTVLAGPAVLKLRNGRLVEPDVFVMLATKDDRIKSDHSIGPAGLVIEVLSPSNRAHDLIRKSQLYRDDGIPEIWYVDHRDQVLIVERVDAGRYQKLRWEKGRLDSVGVAGFGIEVDWLWADPLPDLLSSYRQISRPPKRKR